MDTITLEKPNGIKFQVNDKRSKKLQTNFQTFRSGYAANDEEEPLLPTGFGKEDSEDVKTNNQQDETLYPLGVNPKSTD